MAVNYGNPHTWDVLHMHGMLYTCLTAGPSSNTINNVLYVSQQILQATSQVKTSPGMFYETSGYAAGVATASELTSAKTSCP